jgi:hypothetical protein
MLYSLSHFSAKKAVVASFLIFTCLSHAADPVTGGQGKFAAEEIRREATSKGMVIGDDPAAPRVSITIADGAGDSPQSYKIRVKKPPSRLTGRRLSNESIRMIPDD